jgi:hypothetical protein
MPTPADADPRLSAFLANVRRCAHVLVRNMADPRPASVRLIVAELMPVPPGLPPHRTARLRDETAHAIAEATQPPRRALVDGIGGDE